MSKISSKYQEPNIPYYHDIILALSLNFSMILQTTVLIFPLLAMLFCYAVNEWYVICLHFDDLTFL